MPLGAFRINTLSRFLEPAGPSRDALTVTANNDAQVDTAIKQIGTGSLLVDGSDYLSVDNTGDELNFGTGDWTIECWLYPLQLPGGSDYDFVYDPRITGSGVQPSILINANKVKFFTGGSFVLNSSTNLTTNAWHHIALVKSGSTTTLYQGGSSVGTYSDSNNYDARDDVKIGLNFNNVNGYNGHIDEFRISSSARYTSGFTPSTSAFSNDSDTLLLLHMDGTDGSTTFEDDVS